MKKAPPRKKSTKKKSNIKKAPPRKKSTKKKSNIKKVILILAVLCGIVVSIAKCERGLFDHENAMTVKAVITDVRPYYGGGYGSNYKAVYEYSVNGGTYNSSDQICYDTYKRLNIGDTCCLSKTKYLNFISISNSLNISPINIMYIELSAQIPDITIGRSACCRLRA